MEGVGGGSLEGCKILETEGLAVAVIVVASVVVVSSGGKVNVEVTGNVFVSASWNGRVECLRVFKSPLSRVCSCFEKVEGDVLKAAADTTVVIDGAAVTVIVKPCSVVGLFVD